MLDQAEIFCPHCLEKYFVSLEKIPEEGFATSCKKCGKPFTIVKASGDPRRDRSNRQQGFVVVQAKKRRPPGENMDGAFSAEMFLRNSSVGGLFRKNGFKLGICAAGIVLLVVLGVLSLWKSSVHSNLEKGLRHALAQASDSRFEFKLEDIKFSALGWLTRERGCLSGLTLSDREAKRVLSCADRIHFQIDPSKKRFVTEPFTLRVNAYHSKIILTGCVFEGRGAESWQAVFRAKEATAEIEGMDAMTAQGIEVTLEFNGGDWDADPRLLLGHADLGLKIAQVDSLGANIAESVDIGLSLMNGIFPRKTPGPLQAEPGKYMDTLKTKWAESEATARIERFSLRLVGSAVQLAGKLQFRNPLDKSALDLSAKAKDFSKIMKFIHRVDSETFDRIVLALVDLDEQEVSLYAPNTDSLDLNLSYKTSKITINEQELKPLISSVRAELR